MMRDQQRSNQNNRVTSARESRPRRRFSAFRRNTSVARGFLSCPAVAGLATHPAARAPRRCTHARGPRSFDRRLAHAPARPFRAIFPGKETQQ
ncbi:hypothetical protein NUV26_25895 [Burkholderia pseudomultivorans]|uniref:hypothetical protein n=1 Tax=Burkholderia pseudomultivorans TaxID=1207504 RepID=UPI0012D880B8|nr:hypothetical protein [Burkholderia pseudomultivorans]MBF5014186.1 hypothetical protein [Burkholderia pseudomultivorans]MDS0795610.1 hypothetical protein [Burkholderia pseudomultivorans]